MIDLSPILPVFFTSGSLSPRQKCMYTCSASAQEMKQSRPIFNEKSSSQSGCSLLLSKAWTVGSLFGFLWLPSGAPGPRAKKVKLPFSQTRLPIPCTNAKEKS